MFTPSRCALLASALTALSWVGGCGGGRSSDASLSDLRVSVGTLSPAFSPSIADYTVGPAGLADQVTVTPTTADPDAWVLLDGHRLASGEASPPLFLTMGARTVRVTVVAEDQETTRIYTVTFDRTSADLVRLVVSAGELTPAFQPGLLAYTVGPAALPSTVTLYGEARDRAAVLQVNGIPVAQRGDSAPITLGMGTTEVKVAVLARDGVSRKEWTIRFERVSAALSDLAVWAGTLQPAFNPSVLAYRVGPALLPAAETVTPTPADPAAEVRVNGVLVPSGTPSAALPIGMGETTASVVVRSRDGSLERTYVVVFDRTSAVLLGLTPSTGALSPVFASGTLGYTVGPQFFPVATTLTPTGADPKATIKVNGQVTPSGSPSARIPFLPDATPVTVEVAARDGVTKTTYTVVFQLRRFAYVANMGSNDVTTFSIHPTTGALTEVGTEVPAGTWPWSVTVTPSGRFAYVANFLSNDVTTFSVNPTTGALTEVGTEVAAHIAPVSVTVDPSERFAYVANAGSNDVTTFSIHPLTGALTEVGTEVNAGTLPSQVTLAPSGRFAYVANQDSHDVTTFSIHPTTGVLTEVGVEVAAGTHPLSVAVGPTGRFAYVANYGTHDVTTFGIHSLTGALTEVGTEVAAGVGPVAIAVDPTGRFAYVANIGSKDVTTFGIHPTTGTLTEVGTEVAAGNAPRSVTVDPLGLFVYVANDVSNDVTTFRIDPTTGALTEVGTEVPAGSSPRSIVILGKTP